ncbi:MAG: LysR substrate-binding domain-containing protein [Candidatus Protistobacter heckmanni]|nr:LysR substrate-binding domain-containing protein [Candidatus Protistobacter heckmanni]
MDHFKQISAFASVAQKGSLSAAALAEGVAAAVIGRRLDALEERLGVKLFLRSTRKLTLTFEGAAFLEHCQRILAELNDAEASGHLRISAPAGFGRRHVAPLLPGWMAQHPEVTLTLDLSDRIVDLVNEGFDCAIRLGDLPDSSLVSIQLADIRRLCVAAPGYLARQGTPRSLEDLSAHRCLTLPSSSGQSRGWTFREPGGGIVTIKTGGAMECSDGAVLHEWCLQGYGIAWRSMWEVGGDLAAGRLVAVLEEFAAPPVGIHAVFAQRRHLPLRVRLLIDHLRNTYGRPDYWQAA